MGEDRVVNLEAISLIAHQQLSPKIL